MATAYFGANETESTITEITTSTQKTVEGHAQTRKISRGEEKVTIPVIAKDGIRIVQDLKLIKVNLRSPQSSSEVSDGTSSDVTVKISQGVNIRDVDVEHEVMLKKFENAEVSEKVSKPSLSRGFSTHTEETSADIMVAEYQGGGTTTQGRLVCPLAHLYPTGF